MQLLDVLNSQRRHVLGSADGLAEEDLRRPVLPSGWNILGLINHLALDVEMFWFRAVVGGDQAAIDELARTEDQDAWLVPPDTPAAAVLDNYRQQIELANAVITTTPKGAVPTWWPNQGPGDWRPENHRQVLLHVITETACHAGHLDAARELIDGKQWLILR
jgi:uncharacterized damage-inducible protein DinB